MTGESVTQALYDADAALALAEARERAAFAGRPVLVSISRPVREPLDLLAIAAAAKSPAAYWARPGLEVAALGLCFRTPPAPRDPFGAASRALAALFEDAVIDGWQRPFALGGFRFVAGGIAPEWSDHGPGHLTIPALALVRRRGVTFVTWSRLVHPGGDDPDPPALPVPRDTPVPRHEAGEALPEPREWEAAVRRAVERIAAGELSKVVLARRFRLQADGPLAAAPVLRVLRHRFRGAFTYIFREEASCFLGASPELLVSRAGDRVTALPLAGTRRKGATPQSAAATLMDDPKERQEHRIVVEAVAEALGPACSTLTVPGAPRPVRTGALIHLGTKITGRLASPVSAVELAGRLHPTPAVGGAPWERALEVIRELEAFDRGWYAGPVGWVDSAGDGEFAIALRCALIEGSTATLFAGAGIVRDSQPERESAETAAKFRPMLGAFGAEGVVG